MEIEKGDVAPKCPSCASKFSRCLETRSTTFNGIKFTMRRRKCGHCNFVYTTKQIKEPEVVSDDVPLPYRPYPHDVPDTSNTPDIPNETPDELTPIPDIGGINEEIPEIIKVVEQRKERRKKRKKSGPSTEIFPEIDPE